VSWGASREVREVVGASNWKMVYLVAQSTCGGGRPKSDEVALASPARQGLGSSLGKLHSLSGKSSKGSGSMGKAGHGGRARAVVAGGGACLSWRTPVISGSGGALGAQV
jgi:hypothetical protein